MSAQPETNSRKSSWVEMNQASLGLHLDRIRGLLEMAATSETASDLTSPEKNAREPGTALNDLCLLFDLSDFERDILLLCAGVELDSRIAELCAQLGGSPGRPMVNLQLACAVLPNPHWTAILPTSPLRRWHLVELDGRGLQTLLVRTGMRLNERVLHYLAGINYLDESLKPLLRECRPPVALLPSHRSASDRIAAHLVEGHSRIAMLTGGDTRSRRGVAATACAKVGARLFEIVAADIPQDSIDRETLARLWEREARLSPVALIIECDYGQQQQSMSFADLLSTNVIVSSRDPQIQRTGSHKSLMWIELSKPTAGERREWWRSSLGENAQAPIDSLNALAAQFQISPGDIEAAIASASSPEPEALWESCRLQARASMDELAQRIESVATWDDLVLPPAQIALLQQIGAHMRARLTVYETWGFGSKSARGLGISALFTGPSGTGKTMAAEVLANELKLDVYRVDLSQVVSKYIGETEKNLRRVFDAAEHGGVILLFDEADALFGKRSEVKDSHDRYANIEVSYLLQQMEAYRGLAILTTNQRSALDAAFLRRLRFIVEFPFPDASRRAEIWRRVFPAATPCASLDIVKLARLSVAGGNIRNIALNAAFLAADNNEPVSMSQILRAARAEYAKLEKSLTDAETADWVPS
jgi:hypothetical protein